MNRFARGTALLGLSIAFGLCLPGGAWAKAGKASPPAIWVESWVAAQQIPEPENALEPADLRDATLRQIVHLSIGGPKLRVRLSNTFGTEPLHVTAARVALPLSPASAQIDPATDRPLSFGGHPDVTVPPGAEYLSDAVMLALPATSSLAVTIHLDEPPAPQTMHRMSVATSYLVHGDHVGDADLPGAERSEHWLQISGVEVAAPKTASTVVTFGDSITDGTCSAIDANERWPDFLAARLQAAAQTRTIGVLNQGLHGNRLLLDGSGPNALARFDRDVLARTNVRTVIVLLGTNDLGNLSRDGTEDPATHEKMVQNIISAYRQILAHAHEHDIRVVGATILPFGGSDWYHPSPQIEADRQAVNLWIRTPGNFDGTIDFDKVVRDTDHPETISPAYDSGDHLHPSGAGYRAMAEAIPLTLFK